MEQFKILTKAVELFKEMNDGKDSAKLRLCEVKLHNEQILFEYTVFDFENKYDNSNRIALEHIRNCVYEQLLTQSMCDCKEKDSYEQWTLRKNLAK